MLSIYTILLILLIFVYSLTECNNISLRTDYYESFSDPVICMEVSHKFPIGPPYFKSELIYHRYSNITINYTMGKLTQNIFKRVERECESSVNFPVLNNDFEYLKIIARMYFHKDITFLAEFEYNFYKGLKFGLYRLMDIYGNFIIRIQLINESEKYLRISKILKGAAISYLKSIKTSNGQLCVITKNNNLVVLNPHFRSDVIYGVIYGLRANIFQNRKFTGDIVYPAYACSENKVYPEVDTIFITDGQNITIQFSVLYYDYEFKKGHLLNSLGKSARSFELSNPKFVDVHNLNKISTKYNKVFLIKLRRHVEICSDKSRDIVYLSEDNTRYFVISIKRFKILPTVEIFRKFDRSLKDPCIEQKN